MQHEVMDLKSCLVVLEADKRSWEEEKQNMQNRIDEINDYSTLEDRSPTTLAIKYMYEMSLKDLEITQLKEDNQELKDRITTKESEDSIEEIRILKEKVIMFKERVIG